MRLQGKLEVYRYRLSKGNTKNSSHRDKNCNLKNFHNPLCTAPHFGVLSLDHKLCHWASWHCRKYNSNLTNPHTFLNHAFSKTLCCNCACLNNLKKNFSLFLKMNSASECHLVAGKIFEALDSNNPKRKEFFPVRVCSFTITLSGSEVSMISQLGELYVKEAHLAFCSHCSAQKSKLT